MKILIIRFSSIGDIVLTTPVLRCLKQTSGLDAEVHYAIKEAFSGIVNHNPHVDKVHCLKGNLRNLIEELRAEHFDQIIDLHHNQRSLLVRLALGKPSRSFKKLNLEKYLLTRFKINSMPDVHIVDRYLETAAHLGVRNDGRGLEYFIAPEANYFPDVVPPRFQKDYIAFSIGGSHSTKRLPNEKIAAICQHLGKPVVLLGGPDDKANGDAVMRANPDKVFNACGQLSLDQSAFMVKMATAVISHDTGLMHIAAAFYKPLVSVWGNTVPVLGMAPYMPGQEHKSSIVEVSDLSCRPCSKIGYSVCPKGHFDCMKKIRVAEIVEAVNNVTIPQ